MSCKPALRLFKVLKMALFKGLFKYLLLYVHIIFYYNIINDSRATLKFNDTNGLIYSRLNKTAVLHILMLSIVKERKRSAMNLKPQTVSELTDFIRADPHSRPHGLQHRVPVHLARYVGGGGRLPYGSHFVRFKL